MRHLALRGSFDCGAGRFANVASAQDDELLFCFCEPNKIVKVGHPAGLFKVTE